MLRSDPTIKKYRKIVIDDNTVYIYGLKNDIFKKLKDSNSQKQLKQCLNHLQTEFETGAKNLYGYTMPPLKKLSANNEFEADYYLKNLHLIGLVIEMRVLGWIYQKKYNVSPFFINT